jgi:hypothetical protein
VPCMQVNLVNRGIQIDQLRVLSTTTTYPTASSGDCSQGSINGICIGELAPLCSQPHVNSTALLHATAAMPHTLPCLATGACAGPSALM